MTLFDTPKQPESKPVKQQVAEFFEAEGVTAEEQPMRVPVFYRVPKRG